VRRAKSPDARQLVARHLAASRQQIRQ
jgi:hypothetical protein